MTGRGTDLPPDHEPESGSLDRATDSSADAQPSGHSPQPVPTVGVWVGPRDDPARFERLEHVGGGAEGAIFRARRPGPGGEAEIVALKEYRPPPGAAVNWPFDGTWRQIENQAWLLRGLPRTDHLVRVRDEFLGAVSGPGLGGDPRSPNKAFETPFVVMEWIDGVRPDMVLRASRSALAVRLGWIRDLADAVDLLHSVSRMERFPLVHGDIKPGNCLITPARGLVLVDTGALQLADGRGDHRGLRSPPYAAPEVLAHPSRRRGTATDLYSFGAVAFFLLTGQAPPSAERPDHVDVARDALLAWRGVAPGRRGAVAAHVLRLLADDPDERIRTSATQWAHELTELVTPVEVERDPVNRPPPRRRTLATAALAAVAVFGVIAVPLLRDPVTRPPVAAPSSSSAPTAATSAPDEPAGTSSWSSRAFADLEPFDAGGGRQLYEQTFAAPSADWPAGSATGYETGYGASGYDVHITDQGVYQPLPGTAAGSVSDQVVAATATFTSGQGAWGVWCRGVDRTGSRRYQFLLSHAGAVRIMDSGDVVAEWMYVEGLDMSGPVTLSARCTDVVGGGVELTLAVNGRTALRARPATGDLGPGYAGIEGMTFSDVDGPRVTATYSRFEIRGAR